MCFCLRLLPEPSQAQSKRAVQILQANELVFSACPTRLVITVVFHRKRNKWATRALFKRLLESVVPEAKYRMKIHVARDPFEHGFEQLVENPCPIPVLEEPGIKVFRAFGKAILAGELAPFVFIQGRLQPEVLQWVQRDRWLRSSADELRALELQSFEPPQADSKTSWPRRPQTGCRRPFHGRVEGPRGLKLAAQTSFPLVRPPVRPPWPQPEEGRGSPCRGQVYLEVCRRKPKTRHSPAGLNAS